MIDAVSRYYAEEQRQRPPRRALLSAAGDGRLRGRAGEGARLPGRLGARARSSSSAAPPRPSTWWPQLWPRRSVGPGDEILITALEHHSNIVPWQMLCEETGAHLRVAPIDDRGDLELDAFAALLGPRTRLVAVTHVSNALGTVNPVHEIVGAGPRAGRAGAASTARRPCRTWRSTCGRSAATSTPSPATSSTARPASACSTAARELLEAMPPYQGGGDMIGSVTLREDHLQRAALQVRGRHAQHRRRDRPRRGHRLRRRPSARRDRRPRGRAARATRTALPRGAAWRPHHRHGAGEGRACCPSSSTASTPTTSAPSSTSEGVAIRTGHHCAQPVMERFGVPATARASLAFYNTREEVDALAAGRPKGAGGVRADVTICATSTRRRSSTTTRSRGTSARWTEATRHAEGHNPLCGDRIAVHVFARWTTSCATSASRARAARSRRPRRR